MAASPRRRLALILPPAIVGFIVLWVIAIGAIGAVLPSADTGDTVAPAHSSGARAETTAAASPSQCQDSEPQSGSGALGDVRCAASIADPTRTEPYLTTGDPQPRPGYLRRTGQPVRLHLLLHRRPDLRPTRHVLHVLQLHRQLRQRGGIRGAVPGQDVQLVRRAQRSLLLPRRRVPPPVRLMKLMYASSAICGRCKRCRMFWHADRIDTKKGEPR